MQVGVHQVPFGILPWASHNFYFQLPYYLGLEDDYDLGVKHILKQGEWTSSLGSITHGSIPPSRTPWGPAAMMTGTSDST